MSCFLVFLPNLTVKFSCMLSLVIHDDSFSLNDGLCDRIEPHLVGFSSCARLSKLGSCTLRTRNINGLLKNCTSFSVADSLRSEWLSSVLSTIVCSCLMQEGLRSDGAVAFYRVRMPTLENSRESFCRSFSEQSFLWPNNHFCVHVVCFLSFYDRIIIFVYTRCVLCYFMTE